MRILYLVVFLSLSLSSAAQGVEQLAEQQVFSYLSYPNRILRNNDTLNERVIDLVKAFTTDSVVPRKIEHHHLFFVGWFISTFAGYNWRAINTVKQKYVGTVERASRSNSAEFTEHDVNFDIYSTTRKYLFKSFEAYDCQKKLARQGYKPGKHRRNYNVPPFVRDTNACDRLLYRVHAELTPPEAFRRPLNDLFYPVYWNRDLNTHPNIMDPKPSIGVYGVYCSDCNHTCHAEIHPYEWIWWLNTADSNATSKKWVVGLFKDGSNRFPKWSPSPKIGRISIPFSFHENDTNTITFHPLLFDRLLDDTVRTVIPADAHPFLLDFTARKIELEAGGKTHWLTFKSLAPIQSNGLQCWFSDVVYDEANKKINGYLNVAIATEKLFTFKLEVE